MIGQALNYDFNTDESKYTNIVQERLGVKGYPQHQRAQDDLHGDDP
jgi:hypothetical protein